MLDRIPNVVVRDPYSQHVPEDETLAQKSGRFVTEIYNNLLDWGRSHSALSMTDPDYLTRKLRAMIMGMTERHDFVAFTRLRGDFDQDWEVYVKSDYTMYGISLYIGLPIYIRELVTAELSTYTHDELIAWRSGIPSQVHLIGVDDILFDEITKNRPKKKKEDMGNVHDGTFFDDKPKETSELDKAINETLGGKGSSFEFHMKLEEVGFVMATLLEERFKLPVSFDLGNPDGGFSFTVGDLTLSDILLKDMGFGGDDES